MSVSKKRIVVKVGTSTITNDSGNVDIRSLDHLCRALSGVENLGYDLVLVSSGAIAVGAGKMRLAQKPKEIRLKQAAAAVGQTELMHLYDKFFGEYNRMVGQILLDNADFCNPARSENLKNTFDALLENHIIPIVNENDTIWRITLSLSLTRMTQSAMLRLNQRKSSFPIMICFLRLLQFSVMQANLLFSLILTDFMTAIPKRIRMQRL